MGWTNNAMARMVGMTAIETTGPIHGTPLLDFLGILCVALPHDVVVARFLERLRVLGMKLSMTPRQDFCAAFDSATWRQIPKPENPVAVRSCCRSDPAKLEFQALGREKDSQAKNACRGRTNLLCSINLTASSAATAKYPDNWTGLDATMPP